MTHRSHDSKKTLENRLEVYEHVSDMRSVIERCPKRAPTWPKIGPRWPKEGPKRPQNGPKMAPSGDQMGAIWGAREGPKRGPEREPQKDPQNGPTMAQKRTQYHSSKKGQIITYVMYEVPAQKMVKIGPKIIQK